MQHELMTPYSLKIWKHSLIFALLTGPLLLYLFASDFQLRDLRPILSAAEQLREIQILHPLLTACLFFVIHCLTTALSLPTSAIFTLAAGLLFGKTLGLALASFATSIGSLLAMLLARKLFRDFLRRKFPGSVAQVTQSFTDEGWTYLVGLRLNPIFPFFMVNLLLGLTQMSAKVFYIVTQIAMLPIVFVYTNAGAEILRVGLDGDFLSIGLLVSLAGLGLVPLSLRWLVIKFTQPAKN